MGLAGQGRQEDTWRRVAVRNSQRCKGSHRTGFEDNEGSTRAEHSLAAGLALQQTAPDCHLEMTVIAAGMAVTSKEVNPVHHEAEAAFLTTP